MRTESAKESEEAAEEILPPGGTEKEKGLEPEEVPKLEAMVIDDESPF